LKERIVAESNARDDVGGAERDLLNFGEKLLRFAIQNQLPDLFKGYQFFGPYFGGVKNVKIEVMFLRCWNDLDAKLPFWKCPIFYGIIQIFPMEIWQAYDTLPEIFSTLKLTRVLARNLEGFVPDQAMDP
jgi:hypothetical protein